MVDLGFVAQQWLKMAGKQKTVICAARTSTRSWLGGLQAQVLNQGLKSSSVWKFSATPFKHTFNRQRLGNLTLFGFVSCPRTAWRFKNLKKKNKVPHVLDCVLPSIFGESCTSLPKQKNIKIPSSRSSPWSQTKTWQMKCTYPTNNSLTPQNGYHNRPHLGHDLAVASMSGSSMKVTMAWRLKWLGWLGDSLTNLIPPYPAISCLSLNLLNLLCFLKTLPSA